MSVGDIYGSAYEGLGLPANMIASSFGKLKDYDKEQIE
jgi:pantothenate kinase